MLFGEKISEARRRVKMTQSDLGEETNYSREMIAKVENGTRKIPKESISKITQSLDDPKFFFESWQFSAGVVSIPYFDGEYIEHHPASMRLLVEKETMEAMKAIENVNWFKPTDTCDAEERENIKKLLIETLDAAATMVNLVALICREYKFSMKEIFKVWNISLKIRKYNK